MAACATTRARPKCRRGERDDAVEIRLFGSRTAADKTYEMYGDELPISPMKATNGKKVAVVGAGPAGLPLQRGLWREGAGKPASRVACCRRHPGLPLAVDIAALREWAWTLLNAAVDAKFSELKSGYDRALGGRRRARGRPARYSWRRKGRVRRGVLRDAEPRQRGIRGQKRGWGGSGGAATWPWMQRAARCAQAPK